MLHVTTANIKLSLKCIANYSCSLPINISYIHKKKCTTDIAKQTNENNKYEHHVDCVETINKDTKL